MSSINDDDTQQKNENIAFFIFFGVAVALFTVQLVKHFHSLHAPFLQRYFIRLVFLPVVYAFCALLDFVIPDSAKITDIVSSYYESYCLASFFNIMVSAAGGIEMAARVISGQIDTTNPRQSPDTENQKLSTGKRTNNRDEDVPVPVNQENNEPHPIALTVEVRSNGYRSYQNNNNNNQTPTHRPSSSSSAGTDTSNTALLAEQPILLNMHLTHGVDGLGSGERTPATKAALRQLKIRRFMTYQVVIVKTSMSILSAIIISEEGKGSTTLIIPSVIGLVSIGLTLRALFYLYKTLQPSGLLQKISPVKKLFWMKTQIGLEVLTAFILQVIADQGSGLPGPDDYDKYEKASRILAVFVLCEAITFLLMAFWLLPADDPAIQEWENVMHLQPENKCNFCCRLFVLCDIHYLQAPPIKGDVETPLIRGRPLVCCC